MRPASTRLMVRLLRHALARPALAVAAAVAIAATAPAAPPAGLAGSGVATVPADAAFFSSALRLEEQFDRFQRSNAYARLRSLPAIARALDSWEEQRDMPGSPVSMALTFLELPENAQAVELLSDMVAADTFLYGEPSVIKAVKLFRVLQAAQQAAALEEMEELDEEEMLEEEILELEEEMEEEEDGGNRAAADRLRVLPVRRQVEFELARPTFEVEQAAALVEALAANLDLVEVPDVVWGFKTGKREAGQFQLKRLEMLAKLLGDMSPDLAGAIARKKVAGGEVLAFTIAGRQLPWNELATMLEDEIGESEELEQVLARLRKLEIVVALGLIGDWVVLSIGDSLDHLDKLVLPGGDGKPLIGTPPFAKLVEHADKPLTGISYVSEPLAAAFAAAPEDFEAWVAPTVTLAEATGDLPPEAVAEMRQWTKRFGAELGKRTPKPGAWLAFSFLTTQGYEGYAWNWTQNLGVDGGKPLGLLEHAGGAPVGVAVTRFRNDPELVPALTRLAQDAWKMGVTYGRPALDDDDRERFDEVAERLAPLGVELGEILTSKFLAALADGEVGFVLDADATSRRPQDALPAADEPLPLPELAIALPLADRKLFVEGLNDFFAWGDKLVAELRRIDPDSVPEGYRIPEPTRVKTPAGGVWSFAIPDAGLDGQLQPAIGVGDSAAVFALAPGQAARLLPGKELEPGAQLTKFGGPLAAAAALDVPALVDLLEPWIVYLTRYGCVMAAEGEVDPERRLSAEDETPEAAEALAHVRTVLQVARCLKAAVAETAVEADATVTHWRNLIEDLPKR